MMDSFRLGKKGQADNYFAAIVFLFGFGICSLIGYVLVSAMIDSWTTSGFYVGDVAVAGAKFMGALSLFDYLTVLMTVVLIVGVGITSFKLAAPPISYFLTFFMAAFYGVVSYFFNYIFIEIVSQDVFLATSAFFPRTIMILTNLHWVMLVMIVVGSITLFGKKPKGQFLT